MMNTMKFRVDENEAEKFNKVKKLGATTTTTDNTKRSALGDLQNRGVLRAVVGKEAAKKDLKDTKLQNTLRTTKARVDSHWKNAPLGSTAAPANAANNALAQRRVLTRSNSVRLGTSGVAASAAVNGGIGAQRNGSSNILVGQKPKTLITKVVDSKVQQVKYITKAKAPTAVAADVKNVTVEPTLRREDSNLSRKSLTKLKAALTRDTAKPVTKTNSASAVLALKKEQEHQVLANKGVKVPAASSSTGKLITQRASSAIKIISVQTHSSGLLNAVEDIDAGDADNLVLVSEYVNDIYNYLYSLEVEQAVNDNHLAGQEEVYAKMRSVLIDWINEVHLQFHLAGETFQMAVAIIDRYLQAVKDTKRSHLQLVGVTALFIAAKYEELFPPSICDFVYITDDTYTVQQILQMELKIFRALDCNLSRPLPIHFLRRYSKAAKAEDCHHAMSKYFLELASIEYDLAAYKPSEIAAASLYLSLHLLKDNAKAPSGFNAKLWTPTLEWYSRYSPEHLQPITMKIAAVARNAPTAKLKAVYTKYQSSKFHKISMRSELYGALMDSIVSSKE